MGSLQDSPYDPHSAKLRVLFSEITIGRRLKYVLPQNLWIPSDIMIVMLTIIFLPGENKECDYQAI
jgi:hypothetical protein